MDASATNTDVDLNEVRKLLEQAVRENEAEAVSAQHTLDALVQDGAASSDSMGNVVAAARHSLADVESILGEVSAAFERMEAGVYGVCETCGRGIGMERLRLRPYVRTCVQCTESSVRR